jgi:hypothetical protein
MAMKAFGTTRGGPEPDRRAASVAAVGEGSPFTSRMAILGGRLGTASWSIGGRRSRNEREPSRSLEAQRETQ